MGRLIIKTTQLIDGTGAPPAGQVALVAEGRMITEIAPLAALKVAQDDEVIDATSYTVMPGMMDAHTHVSHGKSEYVQNRLVAPSARVLIESWKNAWTAFEMGFTSLRDIGSRDYVDVALRDAIDAGVLAGPRLRVAGQALSMHGGHGQPKFRPGASFFGSEFGLCNTPEEAAAAARFQVSRGVDLIKLNTGGIELTDAVRGAWNYPEMDVGMITAAVRQVAKVGKIAGAHCHGNVGAMNTILGGVKTLEHAHFLSEEHFEQMLKHDTMMVPTWAVSSIWAENERLGKQNPHIPQPRPYGEWVKVIREAKFKGAELALKMGVKIVAGTDAGFEHVEHGVNGRELEFLVEAGMTPLQAIRSATSLAAEALNFPEKTGTLKPGFWCDVIVVNGDPLANIKILSKKPNILMVIKDGRVLIDRRPDAARPLN